MPHSETGWHPEDIKAALRKRYGTLKAVAESWGLHRTVIPRALRRPNDSIPVERRIAKALNLAPHVLWPDRWSESGEPLPRADRNEHSRRTSKTQRQKREAA